jgi:hypothetical protein
MPAAIHAAVPPRNDDDYGTVLSVSRTLNRKHRKFLLRNVMNMADNLPRFSGDFSSGERLFPCRSIA